MRALTGQATPLLIFANQSRGLAALSVAFSHPVGVFWLARDFLQSTTLAPAGRRLAVRPVPKIVAAPLLKGEI